MTSEGVSPQSKKLDELNGFDEVEDAPQTDEETGVGRYRMLRTVIDWFLVLSCSLVLALLLRAFLVEVFVIPSGSMSPTLTNGNRVAVYKLGYRFNDVSRGDVVVFKSPDAGPGVNDLIKRVVALEGETFEIRDGAVYIDGELLDEPYLSEGEPTFPKAPITGCLNDAEPQICLVPDGMVLMLGDSREASRDSRFFGPVDVDDIVGRAFVKIWPLNDLGGL